MGQKTLERKTVSCARLTVRGFKDLDKDKLATYAGTASRWCQRLIVATAAQARRRLLVAGIEKAFLQGMTYEEMTDAGHSTETKD
eukprot:7062393-Lingulodinium_polyedra.AAC.1